MKQWAKKNGFALTNKCSQSFEEALLDNLPGVLDGFGSLQQVAVRLATGFSGELPL